MEMLKQWIICIIFCSLVGAVVSVISPKGGTERVMKTVIASFLICAFLSPFLQGVTLESDFELPDFSEYQNNLSDMITDAMISETENQAKIEIEKLFTSLNVEYEDIKVYAGVNSENAIYIKYISVTLPKKFSYREKQIASNLRTMFSSEAEFVWVKE